MLTDYSVNATADQIVVVLEGQVDVGLLRIFDVNSGPIEVRVTAVGIPSRRPHDRSHPLCRCASLQSAVPRCWAHATTMTASRRLVNLRPRPQPRRRDNGSTTT